MALPETEPAGAPEEATVLRLIICGSGDASESTFIGHLLHGREALVQDQPAAPGEDLRRWPTRGDAADGELPLGGLAAERGQGNTIDLAYRCFGTPRRRFIAAAVAGHEQHIGHMVAGASTAEVAVIVVDAVHGMQAQTQALQQTQAQTRRQACLVGLLGVRQLVLAVSEVDSVGLDQATLARIDADFRAFLAPLGPLQITTIPVSLLQGDNVVRRSLRMPWYRGPTLLEHLEDCPTDGAASQQQPMRLLVQAVMPPDGEGRGYRGLLAAGQLRPGSSVRVLPSGRQSVVSRIVGFEGDLALAVAGETVTVRLQDDLDLVRGDLISAADAPAQVADQFECTLVWMDEAPLLPGRRYTLMRGGCSVNASITDIKHRLDVNTLQPMPARTLALNEIGVCKLALEAAVPFEPYAVNRVLGGFSLVDRISRHTVAAGMLHFALRRSQNLHLQPTLVDKAARTALLGQQPLVLWFTGLSGAGKSSIANEVAARLHARGLHTTQLDGDNLRHGLNRDLGFTAADRVENIRRVAEVSRLMVDAGLIVLASFISPFRSERELARSRLAPGEFIEVYVDVPLAVAEVRDPKGLYARARRGELPHFTGIDSPYEAPEAPEVHIRADLLTLGEAADVVMSALRSRGLLTP